MSDGSDKRDALRAPIELKVEYKKMNTFFADYTKNISKGGTFIKTDRPLPVGTEFLFKLTLPKRDHPFELKGTVMWTNKPTEVQNPEIGAMGMGIRFIFENDSDRSDFESQVEALMVDSLVQMGAERIDHQGFESQVEALMVDSLGTHLYEKLLEKKH